MLPSKQIVYIFIYAIENMGQYDQIWRSKTLFSWSIAAYFVISFVQCKFWLLSEYCLNPAGDRVTNDKWNIFLMFFFVTLFIEQFFSLKCVCFLRFYWLNQRVS